MALVRSVDSGVWAVNKPGGRKKIQSVSEDFFNATM